MSGAYESARDRGRDLELDADTVVVGSGASGATVATILAEAGERVIVLEEGPRVDAGLHGQMRPSESLRHVWRDGGFTVALGLGDTPAINVTMGRVVGGSSVVTGGVCFRTPDRVLDGWARDLGLRDYAPRAMEPYFDEVERHLHVEKVTPDRWSKSTIRFGEGAKKRGYALEPMHRNTDGCRGHGRCNFGCPEKAKLSVDLSYLPRAVANGATVWSHCRVDEVWTKRGRAIGVRGRLLDGRDGRAKSRLKVRAKRVVMATSAWFTPGILARSGLRHRELGRRMTLHPGFRMIAAFDEPIEGWKGAMQSAFSEAFEKRGITLTALFIPVSVIGATMPGIGPAHVRRARRMKHLAMFGGMLHDEGGGRVRHGPGGAPIATYRMSKLDRARVPDIVRVLGDTFLAAGASEVFPPVLGLDRGLDADAFARFPFESLPGRRFECSSQHPLGTARMGRDRATGVVDADGKVWDVEGLYVADGSVLPTSLGVNPQESIMAVATRIARRMVGD